MRDASCSSPTEIFRAVQATFSPLGISYNCFYCQTCFTSNETWWYYGCIGLLSAKDNSAANYLSPAGRQLLRHMSLIPPLHPKNLYHCEGVSPLHAWTITWLLLKVFRHCWRCCCGPLKSYRPWNCHWERRLHDTDSLQVRLMGWVAASAASGGWTQSQPRNFPSWCCLLTQWLFSQIITFEKSRTFIRQFFHSLPICSSSWQAGMFPTIPKHRLGF